MELKTEHLLLREVTPEDAGLIHLLHVIPEVDEYNTLGIPENIAQTEKLVNDWVKMKGESPQKKYVFMICNRENELMGLFGLNIGDVKYSRGEVWYKLHPSYWRLGYATEALKAVLDFAFRTLGLHRIEAGCATGNIASAKVLLKAGFTKEGLHRGILPIRGQWVDNYSFAILDKDHFR
ncbi:MAG: GNAT family N-acetyltransferase [Bacteroidota bacterium]